MAAIAGILLVAGSGIAIFAMMSGRGRVSHGDHERAAEAALPPPIRSGGMTVSEALARRRSIREFDTKPVAPEHVAQLCWAAQGITDEVQGYRTAPSAGALYPLTVFVVDPAALTEYDPPTHSLRRVIAGDLRRQLQAAAHDQPCVGAAPICMIIAMDVNRTASKYGDRAERYCLLEAGHVAQNILIQATALGLGGVPVGAFDDGRVATILQLPERLRPVYLVPLGHPPRSE